jgi:hypothetical protein
MQLIHPSSPQYTGRTGIKPKISFPQRVYRKPVPDSFSPTFSKLSTYRKLAFVFLFSLFSIPALTGQSSAQKKQAIAVATSQTTGVNTTNTTKRDSLAYLYRTLIASSSGLSQTVVVARDMESKIILEKARNESTELAEVYRQLGENYTKPIRVSIHSNYPSAINDVLCEFATSIENSFNEKASLSEHQIEQLYSDKSKDEKRKLTQNLRLQNINYTKSSASHVNLAKAQIYPLYRALENYCELISLRWEVSINDSDNVQEVKIFVVPASANWAKKIGGLKARKTQRS